MEAEAQEFMHDLSSFLTGIPAVGLACVIDRHGYNERYAKKYGRQKWYLCKTAFSVVVERAAKYAISHRYKLRILVERCNKSDDGKIKQYYAALKDQGQPFNADTSKRYGPLSAEQYQKVLHELRFKEKKSPLVQIADLYLWPICMGGYHRSNRPYLMLKKAGKLIDVLVGDEKVDELGTKYSCFDLVKPMP